MAKIGIIGGSGLYEMQGVTDLTSETIETPFGAPSDSFICGKLDGVDVVFLPRHGKGHRINPSEINYRANIYGMKTLGVDAIFSVSAVGSLREEIKPMDFVVVDQFVDRTRGARKSTFFDEGLVAHVAFADPVSAELTGILTAAARQAGVTVHERGTYICMEGPQFSTKAESNLYRSWGMDIIGMTNLTEAKLAREAEISYATLAAVTDYDCWHASHETVSVEMILEYLHKNVENAKTILKTAITQAGALKEFSAAGALKYAMITQQDLIPAEKKEALKPIIGKYL